jgi:hypothetical protein
VKIDDAGRPVVALGLPGGVHQVAALDAAGTLRWRQPVISPTSSSSSSSCCTLGQGVFDVGRDGTVAVAQLSQNGEASVRVLNNDDEVTTVDHGGVPALVGADADGYVVVERDSGALALARYPYPR